MAPKNVSDEVPEPENGSGIFIPYGRSFLIFAAFEPCGALPKGYSHGKRPRLGRISLFPVPQFYRLLVSSTFSGINLAVP
ncbi:MAG: hypothetical protein K2F92_01515 [Alistipes sp.]|nr:hypothetical protein [Alistipes sp.]